MIGGRGKDPPLPPQESLASASRRPRSGPVSRRSRRHIRRPTGAEDLLLAREVEAQRAYGWRRASRTEASETAVRCASDVNGLDSFTGQSVLERPARPLV